MKRHLEFSKKIVVWAMTVTTIFLLVSLAGFYLGKGVSPELVNMIGLIVTGVIVSYAGKSGVENYQKIKQNNQNVE